jgi:hypothetical protein
MNSDDHLHNRMVSLATSLLDRTRAGSIAWTATDDERRFLFSGTNTSVSITSFVDEDDDNITSLSLLNSRGTIVESLDSDFEPRAPGSGYPPKSWNKVLDDLYHAARRSALNVDAMLDDLFAELDAEDDDPPKVVPADRPKVVPADDPGADDSDDPPF